MNRTIPVKILGFAFLVVLLLVSLGQGAEKNTVFQDRHPGS